MKYDLIFYIAKKTGYCEKRLRHVLGGAGFEPNRIVSATSPTQLGEEVTHSLRLCRMAVIVGGLRSMEDDNLATVLSRVFSLAGIPLSNMRKLTYKGSGLRFAGEYEGYIIRCKSQLILALPDEPDAIEALLDYNVRKYLKEKLN